MSESCNSYIDNSLNELPMEHKAESSEPVEQLESGNLTTDQTEKLIHFQELTGIEDLSQCRQMLLSHNWNFESAVNAQFTEPEENQVISLPSPDVRIPVVNIHPVDQRVYAIIHRRPYGILGWGYWIVTLPFHCFYSKIVSLFRFACRFLWRNPVKAITSPIDDVHQFKRRFTALYGHSHPNFMECNYSQALNVAKRDLRFLLLYFHNAERKEIDVFCRESLCSTTVVDYLSTTFITWGCDVNSSEGRRALESICGRFNSNLLLAVMVLRRHRLTVVAVMEDSCDAVELLKRLQLIVRDNQHFLVTAIAERDERNLTNSLRQEQDEAYHLSLWTDQQKELTRRRLKEEEIERERLVREEEQRQHEELVRRKNEARLQLPAEPDAHDPNAVVIMFKLPNGVRLDRRFLKTDKITALYNYLFVHEASPDNFNVVRNFPHRVVPCRPDVYESLDAVPTLKAAGLDHSELLYVQDNDA